jgi:hypothetical protein
MNCFAVSVQIAGTDTAKQFMRTVSFIGGGNRSTRQKPPTCRKSLTTLSHNIVHLTWVEFEPTTSVVIGTDYIGSCKSNYHAISPLNTEHHQNKGGLD